MRQTGSFLGQPIRALQTMLRILAEDDGAHKNVIPDGIYGPETMAAVTVFQRMHGLPPTGVTNQATWDAIVRHYRPALTRIIAAQPVQIVLNPEQVLSTGSQDPTIHLVQAMLTTLSDIYPGIEVPSLSGTLDRQTESSLSSFQMLCGLPMSGHLDRNTWMHLALQYPLAMNLHRERQWKS